MLISYAAFRLKRLLDTIKSVEENFDLNKNIKVNYHDEIGEVSTALNSMMDTFK
ncbi:MAG: HAMP domain-containing protein [Colwellia sp.]|nr:HAMP domain-containing protein [Colwellia sp.]